MFGGSTLCGFTFWGSTILFSRVTDFGCGAVLTLWSGGLHSGGLHFEGLLSLGLPISDLELYLLRAMGVYTLGLYILGVYSLGLPISDLDLYLLCGLGVFTLGVYALGVYSLGLPISDLELYLLVLNKRYIGPFKPSLCREVRTCGKKRSVT